MNKDFEEIFNGAKSFEIITKEGNEVKGLINKKANSNMGSLLIEEVNGEKVEQYVQGFPKIHYWDKGHQIDDNMVAFEKLDGSCIAVYPLKDSSGNIIELVGKSRGLPSLDKNLQSMYDLCDKAQIINYFNDEANSNNVLYFELYGIKNIHNISHMDTYIDLALIGISEDGEFLNSYNLIGRSKYYYFKLPKQLFKIVKSVSDNTFNVLLEPDFVKTYGMYYLFDKIVLNVPTVYDGILLIRNILEEINNNYKKSNNRIATEGVVLNGNDKGYQRYLKIKPNTIEKECRTENGIPRKFIIKEVYKFFDEFGSKAKDIYLNEPNIIWDYINNQLLEEFTIEMVEIPKTQKRIKKVFVEVADAKEVPESINNIANKLVEDYPNESISNLMRIFSQEYPFKKKDAKLIYNVLEKIKSGD